MRLSYSNHETKLHTGFALFLRNQKSGVRADGKAKEKGQQRQHGFDTNSKTIDIDVDLTVFHHEFDSLDRFEILSWVTVNRNNIGKRRGLDHS